MKAIPYIHNHATYEWKEIQNAHLIKSLILKALSIKLRLYFGTLCNMKPWHSLLFSEKECTFTPSSMVQFMIGYLSTKEYGVVPSFAGSRFNQFIYGLKLGVLALRQRKKMSKNILTLSAVEKKFTGMHLYGKNIISEYSHNFATFSFE